MKKQHIYTNIHKAISLLTGVGIFQDMATRRAVASSCQSSNKLLGSPPHFICIKLLIGILHHTVSAVMAVLEASRPRRLCLARRVSAPVVFVGVLLLLTSLFTIEGVAQNIVPSAPSGLTLTPGDGQIGMSWTAPASSGSHSITHYEYSYVVNSVGVGPYIHREHRHDIYDNWINKWI